MADRTPGPDPPFGIYEVRLDDAGRLKLPARLRDHILATYPGERLFLTSTDGSTGRIYPLSEWKEILKSLDGFTKDRRRADNFRFHANILGQDAEADKAGRVLLHPKLRQTLGVRADGAEDDERTVWLQWVKRGIEIYNKKTYEERLREAVAEAAENEAYLASEGIL